MANQDTGAGSQPVPTSSQAPQPEVDVDQFMDDYFDPRLVATTKESRYRGVVTTYRDTPKRARERE